MDGSEFDAMWWSGISTMLQRQVAAIRSQAVAQARGPHSHAGRGYKAIDKYTVELTTRVVNALFPTTFLLFLLQPDSVGEARQDWAKFAQQPSARSFKVDRVVPRDAWSWSRFADYWDKARVPKSTRSC